VTLDGLLPDFDAALIQCARDCGRSNGVISQGRAQVVSILALQP
jgi:hypothetical protein